MKKGNKPLLIGITSDYEQEKTGYHARFFLKEAYARYISDAGAVPIILPSTLDLPINVWSILDGLVLSGSGLDISPDYYGQKRTFWKNTLMSDRRVKTEMDLLKYFEDQQKPVLGICGGFQMMNVYRKGTLLEDLPSSGRSVIEHQESSHALEFDKVPVWLPRDVPPVNSFHHQGIDRLGEGLEIFARSPDGVAEGIIDPRLPFFLGVQWHPERQTDHPLSQKIREKFLETASDKAGPAE